MFKGDDKDDNGRLAALLLANAGGEAHKAGDRADNEASGADHHELVDGTVLGRLHEDQLRAALRTGRETIMAAGG